MPFASYRCVCYGDGRFVAIGNNSTIWAYSFDGINWTEGTLPLTVNSSSIAYGDGKFVAVAQSTNASAYSTDGKTWISMDAICQLSLCLLR